MTLSPQEIAEACRNSMWKDDEVAQDLGMHIQHIAPGEATLSMTVTQAMANSHGTAHGGFIFTLADAAFAYACNSYNNRVVAGHCSITYVAPVQVGTKLTAMAQEHVRFGRSGIYDVSVLNEQGDLIAQFRGHSRVVRGLHIDGEDINDE